VRLSGEAYCHARALIADRLGLEFPESRLADLERGLIRASRTPSIAALESYLARLAALPSESPEWRRLAAHLTVGETYFFRDRAVFDALEQQVLPSLTAARRSEGTLRLRLWSAGCATGEEPYSLSILVDRLLPDCADWAVTILGTDINAEALEAAQRGVYRKWSLRETPQWIQDRYFHRRGEAFELDPRIRQMVTFAPLNLGVDCYPLVVTNTSAMDLIICRNVLMYFTREAQRATVARLERALMAGGWLVVSPAEASAELFHPLIPVNFPGATLYRKGVGSAVSHHPSVISPPLPNSTPLVPCDVLGGLVAPPAEERVEGFTDRGTILQRARTLADQGNLEEARRLCDLAMAHDRLDPEAYLLLAAICQEQGETSVALDALRRTLYLAPDLAPAHFLLGSLLLRQGKRKQARRSMGTVVKLLSSRPRDEVVPGGDGLTAGRLLETAQAYLGCQGLGIGSV